MANLTQRHIVTIIDLLREREKQLIEETDLPNEISIVRQYKDVEKRKTDELNHIKQIIKILEDEIGKTVYKFESMSFEPVVKDIVAKPTTNEVFTTTSAGTMTLANYGLTPKSYGN